MLVTEVTYNAGPTQNDIVLLPDYPFLVNPHRGYDYVKSLTASEPGTVTSIGSDPIGLSIPKGFILEQNYPNPFNPSTTISYHVAKENFVNLRVYDMLGQEVTTLVSEQKSPGTYNVNWNASVLASGTYFYRLEVGGDVVTKKAVLIK